MVTLIPIPSLLGVPGAEDDGRPRHEAQIRLDLFCRLPAARFYPAQLEKVAPSFEVREMDGLLLRLWMD